MGGIESQRVDLKRVCALTCTQKRPAKEKSQENAGNMAKRALRDQVPALFLFPVAVFAAVSFSLSILFETNENLVTLAATRFFNGAAIQI